MHERSSSVSSETGFSLIELMIALTVTLVVMGIATTLLARSLGARTRENQRTDAIADVQRGLNIMSREIANAGFNMSGNGIVAGDSNSNSIRIRSNLNRYDGAAMECLTGSTDSRCTAEDVSEDLKYFVNAAADTNYLVRYDDNQSAGSPPTTPDLRKTVLANRLDSFRVHYYNQKVTYDTDTATLDITNVRYSDNVTAAVEVTPDTARYIVLCLAVGLDAMGTPGSPGYQPATRVMLTSDVALRNNNVDLISY